MLKSIERNSDQIIMKDIYVSELEANQTVTTILLVKAKEIKSKKSGEPFLSLLLGDKSGEVDAKMWDNIEEVESTFERDDFVKVKGLVQVYRNKPQLTLYKLRRCRDEEVDFADYFPKTAKDVETMFQELLAMAGEVQNPWLRQLLDALFQDAEFVAKFKQAPAAKSLHHAWLGGLLEHTLSVCQLCRLLSPHYPDLNADLLFAGAVLHDIGKTEELSYTRSFNYTSEGQLLGHMILELDLVNQKIAQIQGFPRNWKALIQHLIISHHGEYEFGSPKLPMFPEALLLHCLDNMDSKLEAMCAILRNDRSLDGEWTGHNQMFGRALYKGLQKNGHDDAKEE
jgi:3'-5' exoribonuclease